MSNGFVKGFWKVSPLVLAVSSALLVGCSDNDSDSSSDEPVIQQGTFVDSAVEGIHYATATQSGSTNSDGEYNFLANETVTFSIGDLDLPLVAATGVVTPLTLSLILISEPTRPY